MSNQEQGSEVTVVNGSQTAILVLWIRSRQCTLGMGRRGTGVEAACDNGGRLASLRDLALWALALRIYNQYTWTRARASRTEAATQGDEMMAGAATQGDEMMAEEATRGDEMMAGAATRGDETMADRFRRQIIIQ
jgi:hypothetical protein